MVRRWQCRTCAVRQAADVASGERIHGHGDHADPERDEDAEEAHVGALTVLDVLCVRQAETLSAAGAWRALPASYLDVLPVYALAHGRASHSLGGEQVLGR